MVKKMNSGGKVLVGMPDGPPKEMSRKDYEAMLSYMKLLKIKPPKPVEAKKSGGVAKMKIGGLTGNIQLTSGSRQTASDTARERSRRNLNKEFQEKKKKLREKFKGRGTAGNEQYKKEVVALENKFQKKYNQDRAMAKRFGKDAYKSQAFGVSPTAPKRKKKKINVEDQLKRKKIRGKLPTVRATAKPPRPANSQPIVKKGTTSKKKAK
jgi:hypothetical protein